MSAADVVARQVEAYNAHDLEAFASCYADDVVVTSGAGDVLLSGIAALRQQYGEWFSQMQDLSAEVVQRLTRGAWVVARTRGRPDSLIADAAWRSTRTSAAFRAVTPIWSPSIEAGRPYVPSAGGHVSHDVSERDRRAGSPAVGEQRTQLATIRLRHLVEVEVDELSPAQEVERHRAQGGALAFEVRVSPPSDLTGADAQTGRAPSSPRCRPDRVRRGVQHGPPPFRALLAVCCRVSTAAPRDGADCATPLRRRLRYGSAYREVVSKSLVRRDR